MNNKSIFIAAFISLLLGCLLTGCVESHQEAIASVDIASMDYDGVSDFSISGEKILPNLGYLIVEDLIIFGDNPSGANLYHGGLYYAAGGPSADNGLLYPNVYQPSVRVQKNDFFTLSEELEFVGKGYNEKDGTATGANSLYYLELPVLLNYNHKLSNGHFILGGIGAYAASGLFGHYSTTFDGKTTSGSIKFGPTADYDRMDYGVVLKAGYSFTNKLSGFINYDFGLRNIYSPEDKLFNRSIGFNIAYQIK